MVRDRLILGLRDKSLTESLQMDSDLTLKAAVAKARLRETVHRQQQSHGYSSSRHDDTHAAGLEFHCILDVLQLSESLEDIRKGLCWRVKLFEIDDLGRLGRDLHRVVIIDNSPASYIFHPDNAVTATAATGGGGGMVSPAFPTPPGTQMNGLLQNS
ncbi:nuclear lim interactor-interacting factor, putative [Ixodes scapularis]|uniref:Nuclear lim interactor-interacting factor, putative n=1 Tax=Ixodes scapularis TaxID=6945 RepID=B7Q495_IXOSC|nr:nuclear lim interactor-interacting factor, putative [Ixodes scapularis]|eukprot:XP_002411501.1 nuclear lim interactor-interacting factor, putative [Ixodes scapularis]